MNEELEAMARKLRDIIEDIATQMDMMGPYDPRYGKFKEALHLARAGLASLTRDM